MALTETELIQRAQKGDMQAFEDLVYRYDRWVLGIALRYTNDPDLAQDIYQETFMRVFRSIKRFRFESQFSTWMYRIAANLCLSYQASDRSHRQISIDGDIGGERNHLLAESELVSSGDSEDQVAGRELAHHLRNAIGQLSPQQRLVFVLRHYEGHRLKEIASIIGCAEGTVKKHLFTATARLRESLEAYHG